MTLQDNPFNPKLYSFVNTLLVKTKEGKITWEKTGGRTYRCIGGNNSTVISASDGILVPIGNQAPLTLKFFNQTDLLIEYRSSIIQTQIDNTLQELFSYVENKSCEDLGAQFDQFITIVSGETKTVETK